MCVTKDIQTGEVKVWKRPDEQNQEELREYLSKYILVGHNAIWFDTPVLNRLCKTQIDPERVIDTLVVSRLVNSWDYNRHGLADWGERLNLPKGDFFDFSRLSQEMIDYCMTPDHKVLRKDLRWIPSGEIQVGDEILGFDEFGPNRRFKGAIIEGKRFSEKEVFEVSLKSGKAFRVTGEHLWLTFHSRKDGGSSSGTWVKTKDLRTEVSFGNKQCSKVARLLDEWEEKTDKDAGYLAGIYDGEGCTVKNRIDFLVAQNPGSTLEKVKTLLGKVYSNSIRERVHKNCRILKLLGNRYERLKFLGEVRPERLIEKIRFEDLGRLEAKNGLDSVVSITSVGKQTIVEIQTSTRTLVLDGYPMHNCIRDVEVTEKVFNFLKSTILDPRWKDSMRNEHRAAIISTEMHYNGFPFDVKKAEELYKQIEEERRLLNLEIQEAFPPKSVLLREINPIPTKTGKIHSKDFRWLDGLPEDNGYIVDSPFSLFEFEPFNPSSTKQCIERLNEFGWKPTEKTKGHIKAERDRDYEKLEAYKKTGWTISEENLNTLPPSAPPAAHKLVRYILLSRRLTTLNEWLAAYNPKTQCIHGEIKPIGTWTHRAAHKNPNTGNIIRIQNDPETKEVLWGEKGGWGADYRSLWTVKPGWKLVGCDAEGIQLRVLAHYMEDEEFTQALVSGSSKDETDVHSLNRKKLNNSKTICKTRNDAKTFIYSWVLGASAPKTAQVLECSVGDAVVARQNFLDGYPGLKYVKEEMIPQDVQRGYFIGFDGRLVMCNSNHLMLAGYLQNGEAVIMKYAMWLAREKLRKEKIPFRIVNFVHDEIQCMVKDTEGLPEYTGQVFADAIVQAGKDLGVKCPQAGTWRTGYNWMETH